MTIMAKLVTPKMSAVGYWNAAARLSHNKQFKRDSQRLALLLLLQFSVYGTIL